MSIECEKAGGINLAQGVCDNEVPVLVRAGAQQAIDRGINSYTRFDGLQELRTAIASKLDTYNNIQVDSETQIIVSAGSTGAFYCACLALLNPGDEVILFEPFYGYHLNTLQAVDAVPKFVPMRPPNWEFDPEDLEKAISSKTKGIMVNTPANPSGKVFSRKQLQRIAEVAERHDLVVFTDEIYEYILYDDHKHLSPASMPEFEERTITISGYSKTFSITGWRIGFCACPVKWAQMIGYMNDLVYVCAPSPLQMGVALGLAELQPDYYKKLAEGYELKRDRICSALRKSGLTPHVPEGAYYVLADVSKLPGRTSKERAMFLLSRTGVASVPGNAFYREGSQSHLARFCFAKSDHELNEACDRLSRLK